MATIFEPLSSQIDGVKDTFETVNPIDQGLFPIYNGAGVAQASITVLDANNFKLSFVPLVGDTLGVFLTPDIFDVTSQIDGVTNTFNSAPSDLGEGDFLAVYNGQVLVSDTFSIGQTQFKLSIIPQIGDVLEYFRVQFLEFPFSVSVNGFIKQNEIKGVIRQNKIRGTIEKQSIVGTVDQGDEIQGFIEQNNVIGVIK